MENITEHKKILSLLEKSYLPITSKEVIDITKVKLNTANTYLNNLANQNKVQKMPLGRGSSGNLYLNNKIENEGEIKILVIGSWISKNLEDNHKEVKIESEDQEEIDSKIKYNLFQCVGFLNFYLLRKICAIHRFHSPDKIKKLGVQRQKDEAWIKQLMSAFKSHKAELWSTAIIYFDDDKVDYVKLKDYDNNKEIGIITIPYDGHVFDAEKPGWILDGQQRMWSLENIARRSEDPDSLELIGPVTIGIGEFKANDSKKNDFIRRTFTAANNTKNLPKNFRKDLMATLDEASQEMLTEKDKIETFIASISEVLNIDKDSPFIDLIDMANFGLPQNQGELIARGAIYSMIKEILNYPGFYKDDLPIAREDYRFIFNIELIKDYFNAIKFTFLVEWDKPISESRIRSRLVITTFAKLIETILHISVATSPDRDNRFRSITGELIKLWEDEQVSFDITSPIIYSKRNNLRDIKELTKELKRKYTTNSQLRPDASLVEEIFGKWKILF